MSGKSPCCHRYVVGLSVATLVSCSGPAPAIVTHGGFDLSRATVIDLSHAYDDNSLFWPTSPTTFELTSLEYGVSEGGYFYAANTFCTPEHGGTHIDAPIHFAEHGWTLGEVPVDRLVAPGVVIDVSVEAAQNADYRLTTADVQRWEQEHGEIPVGSIVVLRTGWSRRWPNATDYLGDDTPGDATNLHFPSYGADAARLLVEERSVAALGVDTASIDYGPSTDFLVHQIAAAENVVGLENLTNVDDVPAVGAWIVALPMKIGEGSGGPVRIVALLALTSDRTE